MDNTYKSKNTKQSSHLRTDETAYLTDEWSVLFVRLHMI